MRAYNVYDFLRKTDIYEKTKIGIRIIAHRVSISASIDIYIRFRIKNFYLLNKVVLTFLGRPLLLLIQFFFSECIACHDKMHTTQLQFHFILVIYNTTYCLKPSVIHSRF